MDSKGTSGSHLGIHLKDFSCTADGFPETQTVVVVFETADTEGFDRLLDEKGAKRLPNPPIDMPDWIKDTRN